MLTEKFWWRKDIFTACEDTCEPDLVEMSIDEILNGIPGTDYQVNSRNSKANNIHLSAVSLSRATPLKHVFQGLIALVRDYLRGQDDIEADTMCTLSNYWQLLSQVRTGFDK